MIEHEAVKIGVIGIEQTGVVERVEILDESADFDLVADPGFDDSTEGVLRCSFG